MEGHLAGNDIRDYDSKVQSTVNNSWSRITLKPLHSCFCTTVATASQELQREVLLSRGGETLTDLWICPDYATSSLMYRSPQEDRGEENTLLFLSDAGQQTQAGRQNNWLFLFPDSLNLVNTFKIIECRKCKALMSYLTININLYCRDSSLQLKMKRANESMESTWKTEFAMEKDKKHFLQ